MQDAGENGISGVSVSADGMTAITDENGNYKFIISIPYNTSKKIKCDRSGNFRNVKYLTRNC